MFRLVKYRYVFLIISLLIIIPGTISLLWRGLDVGIDFAGGSIIELQPQTKFANSQQVIDKLKPLNLQALHVNLSENKQLQGDKIVWIRLNTAIDTNVENSIVNTLKTKYAGTNVKVTNIPHQGKTEAFVVITGFKTVPSLNEIKSKLGILPKTSDPSKTTSDPATTPTVGATTTPQATATVGATPTAAATATPKAAATVGVTPTATTTATASSTNNPANTQVSIEDIKQGTSNQRIQIQTISTLGTKDMPGLQSVLLANNGPYTFVNSNSEVGASVAGETTRNAFFAVLAASVLILLYIWFSFRKVAKAWRYGACAIIALLHDALVLLGVFSILGWLFKVEVDALFLTALLTVVGFSVHDTIVVFDRIRENLQRSTVETFDEVVDASLIQTMARSLNTSLTVIFTLTALTIFTAPGTSAHNFTLALLIGIVSGTYSSIFNASMLLVIWEKGELGLGRSNRNRDLPPGRRAGRELARSRG